MKHEEMNGKERVKAAVKFQDHDRTPVFPLTHWGTPGLFGISVEEYAKNPDVQAKCLVDACKMFDYDGINAGVDVIIEAEAFGGETVFPKDGPPFLKKHPLGEDKNKLKELKVLDPKKAGRMPIQVEATRQVVEAIGDEKYTMSFIMGPLNCASQLRGVQDTIIDFLDDPDYLEELLDFATDQVLEYGKALAATGVDCVGIGAALASPNFNSPANVCKYVLPRYKRLITGLHEAGVDVILHICGDINRIFAYGRKSGIRLFQESGTDIVDIDYQVKMEVAIEETGLCCRGNLNPSAVLASGSKETVLEEARKVIEGAGKTKGLILGAGCDMSYYTPKENYAAMVEAAKKYGTYPMK